MLKKAVLGYFLLTTVFLFWHVASFLKDLFVAPLYFLVPLGIGLLFFSTFKAGKQLLAWMTRAQLVLCSLFFGFALLTILYQQLERFDLLRSSFLYVYPTVLLFSLSGFYLRRDLLAAEAGLKSHLKTLLVLSPLFVTMYYFFFLQFTAFPLRDIYQEIHFMKGALEFSRFHILGLRVREWVIFT